jgi:hypothetical protein
MTEKQIFKLAFISKCIEDGLTVDEMCLRVKQALHFAEKRANDGVVGSVVGNAANLLFNPALHFGVAAGAPLALGYYLAGPAAYNAFSKPKLPSREELLQQELQNEYEKQTDMLKKQTEMAKRRKERSKGISGVTRY